MPNGRNTPPNISDLCQSLVPPIASLSKRRVGGIDIYVTIVSYTIPCYHLYAQSSSCAPTPQYLITKSNLRTPFRTDRLRYSCYNPPSPERAIFWPCCPHHDPPPRDARCTARQPCLLPRPTGSNPPPVFWQAYLASPVAPLQTPCTAAPDRRDFAARCHRALS
jgi:hypothetical protein